MIITIWFGGNKSIKWFLVYLIPGRIGIWKCWFVRKTGVPRENLLEQMREPTTNSTHIWHRCQDLNPGHIGGRWALLPLRHPLLLQIHYLWKLSYRESKVFNKCHFINLKIILCELFFCSCILHSCHWPERIFNSWYDFLTFLCL